MPVEAKKYLFGLALSSRRKSGKSFAGMEVGFTTSMLGAPTTCEIGWKSLMLS